MTQATLTLADIWPFSEISAPGEIGSFAVQHFLKPGETEAALWQTASVEDAAPLSTYALRLQYFGDRIEVCYWLDARVCWSKPRVYKVEGAATQDKQTVFLELKSILTGGVSSEVELEARISNISQSIRRHLALLRFSSRVFGILSIVILFMAIRLGVENEAPEVFAVIFLLAASTGAMAVFMRETATTAADRFRHRMERQLAAERRLRRSNVISAGQVTGLIRSMDGLQQDQAAVFGFLLLCVLVYFISPLVVLGVLVGLVAGILVLLGDGGSSDMLYARSRALQRLENALLSWRATLDRWAPRRLRHAKTLVLRAGLERYRVVEAEHRNRQARAALRLSSARGLAFVGVLGAYAFSVVLDDSVRVQAIGDTLAATSLFSVAPVIVLMSASKATASVAQIIVRNLHAFRSRKPTTTF